MSRKVRLAVAGLLGVVLAGAVGVLVAHGASAETWAGLMRLFTCGVLMLSVIGALCGERRYRPRLVGFAAFGWGYFALAHWYHVSRGIDADDPSSCRAPSTSTAIFNPLPLLLSLACTMPGPWRLASSG